MSNGRPPIYKRQFVINKEFQFKFIYKFCIIILIGLLISSGLVFLLTKDTLTSSFHQSRLVIKSTASTIVPAVIYTNLVTLALITVAVIFVTIFISHRIFGPVFRFKKELHEVAAGDLTRRVNLRGKDNLTDLADELNSTISGLRDKVSGIKAEVENILESASKREAPPDLIEELNRLYKNIESGFKV